MVNHIEKTTNRFNMENTFYYSLNHSSKRMDLRYFVCNKKPVLYKKELYNTFIDYYSTLENSKVIYSPNDEYQRIFDIHELKEFCLLPIFENCENNILPIGVLIYGNERDNNCIGKIKVHEQEFINSHKEIIQLSFLFRKKHKSNMNFTKVLRFIVKVGKIRDAYNVNHQYNVAIIAEKIVDKMNLSSDETMLVRTSAMIHDCGKMMIDTDLFKKKKLNVSEMEIIKNHTIYGEKIVEEFLEEFNNETDIGKIIRSHHENYNGTGYPDGIKGDYIPLESAIIRIADSIEAMLGKRHYKDNMNLIETRAEIAKYSGIYYHPDIVQYALKIFDNNELYDIDLKKNDAIVNIKILKNNEMQFETGFLRYSVYNYTFSPFFKCFPEDYDINSIKSISFVLEFAGKRLEYNAKLSALGDNELIFSKIEKIN